MPLVSFLAALPILSRIISGIAIGPTRVRAFEASAFLRSVVKATPKATGRAAAHWAVQNGVFEPGEFTESKTGFAANLREGLRIISTLRRGQQVFVSNATPYLPILNDGFSKQAPKLFVQLAAREAAAEAAGQALKILLEALRTGGDRPFDVRG